MTRAEVMAALTVALLAGPVDAEVTPRTGGFDPRVHVVDYNPLNVVRVVGSPISSTQIIFAAREEVTQVAIGDADAWLAQPAGNLLFLKPTEVRPSTNMQVVTRRTDGSSRSYQFRLVAIRPGASGDNAAFFAVNFVYPDDERAERAAAETRQAAAAAEKTAAARLAEAWTEGPRNWRYVAQGSSSIEPLEVSDNGRQTALRFPGHMRVPTIYKTAPDGTETIVPYTIVGDTIVVQTTARMFILRDGREVLRIVNQGFDPVGHEPDTGTGLPDLKRTVRGAGL